MSGVSYATLAQLRTELVASGTGDDTVILDYGRRMSDAIDTYVTRRWQRATFAPRRVTRYYDCAYGGHILLGGRRLELDAPFVAFVTVVDGEGTTLVANTDYYALPRGETPYTALWRYDGTSWTAYSGDTYVEQIAITGDLCYRQNYTEAWVSATTITEPMSDTTGTTITTASNTILSPGMLIRIDSEWMTIESGSGTSWVVNRGERGSTAATHVDNSVIYRFIPEPTITRALLRWASLVFKRRGQFEQTTFDGTASVQYPEGMPQEVTQLLQYGGWATVRPILV